jgi:hypothetical protein
MSAGVVEQWAGLGEVFNPLEGTRLLVRKSGHLVNYTNLSLPESQPREKRLQLFREHMDDDYVIKFMPFDATVHGIVESIMEANYNIIAIERRNTLSAYLSVLIAYHHQVWNVTAKNEQPVYEPFVVPEEEIVSLAKSIATYHHLRDKFKPSAILYYEDIASQSSVMTLKQAGIYHEGAEAKDSPTKKLLSFEDKTKLIINLEEVIDHLTGILVSYDVTMEHNDL